MKTPCPDFTGHWNPSLSGQAEKTLPESVMELEIPHKEPPPTPGLTIQTLGWCVPMTLVVCIQGKTGAVLRGSEQRQEEAHLVS